MADPADISVREQARAVWKIATYRPRVTAGIAVFGVFAALLEGIGASFLIPIIQVVTGNQSDPGGIQGLFIDAYGLLGVPFTLETIIIGVVAVMTVRYAATFLTTWFGEILRANYIRDLQLEGFDGALHAHVGYFDERGSDGILNAIITQTIYAGNMIGHLVRVFRDLMLALAYLFVAFFFAPALTLLSAVVLGGMFYLIRNVIEPGYTVGDRVAEANERIQTAVQAGTQGIRDVKLYGMISELYGDTREAVDLFADATIDLKRNKAAIRSGYELMVSLTVFLLIYVALAYLSLSLSSLGVFLFAMFRLAPQASALNNDLYELQGDLPHFVRTDEFIDEINEREETDSGETPAPEPVDRVEFDNVGFSYDGEADVLDDFSFEVGSGEFVAFVGQSGAGKSTLVSLLSRLYRHDRGDIRINGTPIEELDLAGWRSQLAIVRQDPHIFNDSLRYNLTLADRDASEEELDRVCEIARVSEFIDGLSDGYETVLGDDGVQLSGGQKQRVSLARALLSDAEVLVLDEATSDLDTELERQVQREIESMDQDYIMIAIAHRLSTVSNADRIYTVESGRIIESGGHNELVDSGGKYAQLYAMQS